MENREQIFAELRKGNVRITRQRKAIIDILENRHLTIQEIYSEMKNRGFKNLGTVYNNIDFLLEHKIITQIFINGKKHFDLTIDENHHGADSHIHVNCRNTNNIIEINESSIYDDIKNNKIFANFNVEKIQLVVVGSCKDINNAPCKNGEDCFIARLGAKRL
jgi:Fur family ferric uptake transcriptional regulator/Fur family peroxide stress response transcriptional regulator